MNEAIYNLLLTGESGLSLPGTLRFRFTDLAALAPAVDVAAMQAAAAQPVGVEVAVYQLAGSLSVPLLTGARPVPLTGVSLGISLGSFALVLNSTDPARRVDLLFNLLDFDRIAGGMVWRRGQLGQRAFSLLGDISALGLYDGAVAEDASAPQDVTA